MKYYIPTYEECLLIAKTHGELVFYETKLAIDGYDISMFNYRLAGYNHFINPLENSPITSKELRGITFVFDKDGSYKHYIMLDKFWNLNQVEETQVIDLKDKKIKAIHNKEDGSAIHFVKLPNGRVLAKTKGSFSSDQAEMANNIYKENTFVNQLVNCSLDHDIVLIWELVSPFNKVVLHYENTNLILLKVRNNKTGQYIDFDNIKCSLNNICIAKTEQYDSLEQIIEAFKTITEKEGVVIQFEDDQHIKAKTNWYFEKHRLVENIGREDYVIYHILNETIDDILTQLKEGDIELKEKIDSISETVRTFLSLKHKQVEDSLDRFKNEFNSDFKSFALNSKKDDVFSYTMSVLNHNNEISHVIIRDMKQRTYFLKDALFFLEHKKLNL